ncbi:hypothetical protein DID88_008526 [Monilinia fructigena]|uniref:Uncharacterized protein n=1 Tax=Monilinia fructigena TaxID=38457 RepID=A0A395JAR2_9HELO|nr:hypothetical protein DID88_008526 [Monilinia fructigena]
MSVNAWTITHAFAVMQSIKTLFSNVYIPNAILLILDPHSIIPSLSVWCYRQHLSSRTSYPKSRTPCVEEKPITSEESSWKTWDLLGDIQTLSALPTQSALRFASGVAFSSVSPLQYLTRDTVTAFATASVTSPSDSVQATYNTAPEFITASPLIYTGNTIKILPSVLLLLLVATISGLCLHFGEEKKALDDDANEDKIIDGNGEIVKNNKESNHKSKKTKTTPVDTTSLPVTKWRAKERKAERKAREAAINATSNTQDTETAAETNGPDTNAVGDSDQTISTKKRAKNKKQGDGSGANAESKASRFIVFVGNLPFHCHNRINKKPFRRR